MSKIIVFGAAGRVGPVIIKEVVERGHNVTAVVRDPTSLPHDERVTVVLGDVTDAASVAALSAGHDVAISSIGTRDDSPPSYLADKALTLLAGLAAAGVERLLVVGGSGSLEVTPGVRLLDTPEFNPDWRPIALAHADSLDALRAAQTPVDWVYVSPANFFDQDGPRTGKYRLGQDEYLTDDEGNSHISYADYAIALVDEIEQPAHHRQRFVVAD